MAEISNKAKRDASCSSESEASRSGRGSCERIVDEGDFDGDASGSRAKRRFENEQPTVGVHVNLPLSPPNVPQVSFEQPISGSLPQ